VSVRLAKILQVNFSNWTKSEWTLFLKKKFSGATKDPEQLQKMLEDLREGDIFNVTDLTRITRSTQDLFDLIDLIRSKKASLKSHKDTC
jgi:DNA invertase Pin-like site-specific DNA recombinase